MKSYRLWCVAGILALFGSWSHAQSIDGPANSPPANRNGQDAAGPETPSEAAAPLTHEELTRQLRSLQTDVKKLSDNLDDTLQLVQQHMETTRNDLSDVKIQIADLTSKQREILEAVAELRASINALGAVEDLRKAAEAIDGPPPVAGEASAAPLSRLNAIMRDQLSTNEGFRQELAEAVRQQMPTEGLLHVENLTTVDRVIDINRTSFTIPANQKRSFKVRLGTVTTQLPDEQMMTWTVGAPNFEQGIQIVPKTQPVMTARPAVGDSSALQPRAWTDFRPAVEFSASQSPIDIAAAPTATSYYWPSSDDTLIPWTAYWPY